ncbi:MAG: hypothetical protein U0792_07895 [Gemmataceae bacterium]
MAAELCEVEVWVVVDEDGDYAVGKDSEAASEAFEADIGSSAERGLRRVKVTVKVPLPKPLEVVGTVVEEEPATA